MEIGSKIHDKLITDFAALQYSNGGTVFTNVKKYFAASAMAPGDCLIMPYSNTETVSGGSAGNTQTTREYGFRAVVVEQIEASDTDSQGAMKYSRLLNTQDSILDYLQREPSNLNSWGNANNIFIFKIRVRQVRHDVQRTEGGYAAILDISFGVFLNVIPQNL